MFVINWEHRKGVKCYVTKGQPNHKPYTTNPLDPDCKVWKTRNNAQHWISGRTLSYAEKCVIEEIVS